MDQIVVMVDSKTFDQIRNLPHIKETYKGIKTVYFDYDVNLVFINKEACIEETLF